MNKPLRTLLAVLLAPAVLGPALAVAQAAPPAPAGTPVTSAPPPPPAAPRRVIRMEEALAAARARTPQLRQAQAQTRAAAARADQARAGLLPQLTLTGEVARSSSEGTAIVTGGSGTTGTTGSVRTGSGWTSRTTWTGAASVEQVLLDVNRIETWRAAGATADATRATERAAELDADSAVRAAFFAARAQRDLVAVAQETVKNDEAHLRQVQGFVDVGTQPAIALARTRADLANARLQLIQAENAYANARSQLLQAMGEPGSLEFDVGDDALPPVPGEEGAIDPLVDEAIAARPELAALLQQRRAEELSRRAARAGWFPTVGARASAAESGPRPDDTSGSWTAGLNLTWSVFDGGLTQARVREAEANLDALRAQEDGVRLQVRVAVEQAVLGVRAAAASQVAASDAVANAREQLRLAEGRFQAGAGSIIELGDAQVAYSTAAATEVQAGYNLAAARAALLRALGRR